MNRLFVPGSWFMALGRERSATDPRSLVVQSPISNHQSPIGWFLAPRSSPFDSLCSLRAFGARTSGRLRLLVPLSSLLLAFVLASGCAAAEPAAAPQLNDKAFWFGNTWGGGSGPRAKWMQQSIDDFVIHGDRIYAITGWDEHCGEGSIYTTGGERLTVPEEKGDWAAQFHSWGFSGGPAVTTDGKYVFYSMGQNGEANKKTKYGGVARYTLEGKAAGWTGALNGHRLAVNDDHKKQPTGLVACDGELFVSDPSADRIRVYRIEDMSHVRDMPCKTPGRIVMDAGGDHALWVIDSSANAVRKIKRTGESLNVQIADCQKPVALCLDGKGNLLVADSASARQQIRAYKAADGSHLAGFDFGSPVYAGDKPGVVAPGKFYRITSIRVDDQGHLYVGCWDYGAKLHKFDANRKQVWVLKGLEFVSCADADPGEDNSIYSPGHRYAMDYAKPPGESWTEAAITLDPQSYPNDPRHAREAWMAMRMYRLDNQKLMLGKAQMGAEMYFWRFKSEIAVPAAMYFPGGAKDGAYPPNHPKGPFFWSDTNGDGDMQADEYSAAPAGSHAAMIDVKGNLWVNTGGWDVAKGKITKVPFAGLNPHGAPTWAVDKATATPISADTGIKHLSKLTYDATRDRMYLAVWTQKHPFPGGGWEQMSVGPVVQCFEEWSKSPKMVWEQVVVPPEGLVGKVPKAWSFETDYGFIAYTWKHEQIAVDVYRLSDGKRMGRLLPTVDIGGVTGWIDMNDAVQTHRRADGTYVVFVEEVWMAKGLYFIWKP